MFRARRALACLIAAFALAACGNDSSDTASDDPYADAVDTNTGVEQTVAPAVGTTILIKGSAFHQTEAKSGERVTVRNEDAIPHTFTADDESFDTGTISARSSKPLTVPAAAGSYKVHCEIHPSITGTLVVS